MESIETYLERKYREIRLIHNCLRSPRQVSRPRTVDEAIAAKFQLTAVLRAEHELQDWNATETAWSSTARPASGPFKFQYDYQRADLSVSGPSFYELERGCARDATYTASGMAAISALLLASRPIFPKAHILVLPGTYGETLELIDRFLRAVGLSPWRCRCPNRLIRATPRESSCSIHASVPGPLRRCCAVTVPRSICSCSTRPVLRHLGAMFGVCCAGLTVAEFLSLWCAATTSWTRSVLNTAGSALPSS